MSTPGFIPGIPQSEVEDAWVAELMHTSECTRAEALEALQRGRAAVRAGLAIETGPNWERVRTAVRWNTSRSAMAAMAAEAAEAAEATEAAEVEAEAAGAAAAAAWAAEATAGPAHPRQVYVVNPDGMPCIAKLSLS
jgi:hypothetical protein